LVNSHRNDYIFSANDCFTEFKSIRTGTFHSENFDRKLTTGLALYPPGMTCGWQITNPSKADITVSFLSFELEDSTRCFRTDYLVVYRQNDDNKEWEMVGRFCGDM